MNLQAIRPEEFPWFPYDGFTFCLGLTEGDAAWTSGHTAGVFDPEVGKMTVGGPMEQQARTAYEKVLAILAAAGFGPQDVTRVTENITLSGLEHYDTAVAIRTELFGDRPTVRTVIVERLVRRAAFIEVELHAVRGGGKPLVVSSGDRSAVTEGHDGLVYLPSFVPVGADGELVAPGDLAGQYAWCLDRAEETLAAAGLTLDHVVTTYDYVTPDSTAADREAAEEVRRERLAGDGVFPAAGRVEMSRLHSEGVLVALDVTASRHSRTKVDPGWPAYDGTTRSPAVRAGRGLFISGLAARDTATSEVLAEGDLEGQAEVLYEQMAALLDHEGLGPEDLLETTEYCVVDAIPTYRVVAPVRERRLRPPWPASTGALCRALDTPGLLLEVFPNALYREDA
jgi:enamine deaminase RidA (YjgF/YER057c/UK114 family)